MDDQRPNKETQLQAILRVMELIQNLNIKGADAFIMTEALSTLEQTAKILQAEIEEEKAKENQ
jgi:hypothetical protein